MALEPDRGRAALCDPRFSVDLALPASLMFWIRHWNVTLIQLHIAVGRVGSSPAAVAKELGLGPQAAVILPSRGARASRSRATRASWRILRVNASTPENAASGRR